MSKLISLGLQELLKQQVKDRYKLLDSNQRLTFNSIYGNPNNLLFEDVFYALRQINKILDENYTRK